MSASGDGSSRFSEVSAEVLDRGHRVRFRAGGRSMQPAIREGEMVTVEPVEPSGVKVGDIVLYHLERGAMIHRVARIERRKGRPTVFIFRGDASLTADEPVEARQICGKVVSVERHGRTVRLDTYRSRLARALRLLSARLKGRVPPRWATPWAALALLYLGSPARAAEEFNVGNFTKTTAGAPASQTVTHGLTQTPDALILWTNGKTGSTFSAHFLFGLGFTDGTTSKSVAAACQDNVATSNTSCRIANKVLTIVQWGEVVLAEADLSSWNSTSFTLNWTTNDANAYVIHFIAIYGSSVSAKVLGWTMPTSTGNLSVTGVGFQPAVVIHAYAEAPFPETPPASRADAAFGLGVMDASGDQWANMIFSLDGMIPTDTQRGQQTDACIYSFNSSLTVRKEASFVSMDSDGFTVNFTTAAAGPSQVISLALTGLNVKPGSFTKSTDNNTPVSQAVTGVGFRPSVIFLTSFQDRTRASPVDETRLGVGAGDTGLSEESSAFVDEDNVGTSNVDGIDKTSKVFMKVDNNTPTIEAEADLTSLDADGFTLNWTTNDTDDTEILYLAFGILPGTAVDLLSFNATRDEDGALIEWRTGHEVDNLGFHLYREGRGETQRVSPSLIAGSALLGGPGTTLTAGRSYSFRDAQVEGTGPLSYWLEDMDLSCKRTRHGPAKVLSQAPSNLLLLGTRTRRPKHPPTPVPLLSRLGRGGTVLGLGTGTLRQATKPTPERLKVHWPLSGRPAVKISVREEGWYRVGQPELLAAGLDPGVDPRSLELFVDGEGVPIVVRGSWDGQLDPEDAVEFYGLPLDTPSTDSRTYWLVEGKSHGKRIRRARVRGRPGACRSFPFTVEQRERTIYFAALRNGEAENFFGAVVGAEPVVETLTLHHIDPFSSQAALLEVSLQGVTHAPHRVQVLLNGSEAGTMEFEGQALKTGRWQVPALRLKEGENQIALLAEGGETDVSLVDSLRITYRHTYTADGSALRFTAPAGQVVEIEGFPSRDIRVMDITDPTSVRALWSRIRPRGEGFAVSVASPGRDLRTLLAFSGAGVREPERVSANRPSRWHEEGDGADMVIIAHRAFLESLMPLKVLREEEGLKVALIDVEDLYDEFSFGAKDPRALRDLLGAARARWSRPPRFVLLVGDASFDPRNHLGLGDFDFVPTKLVPTHFLETASDDWFADLDGDDVAEMAVGRLPVRSVEEAKRLVAKLVGYGETVSEGAWSREALLVADDNDLFDFETASMALEPLLPADLLIREIFLGRSDFHTARALLLESLNAGQLLVNYLGHGSVDVWGGEGLFSSRDAGALQNGPRLPFFVAMNCLNGFFHDLYTECLAEALLKAEGGGAIGVWASSGLTGPRGQSLMNRALVRHLFHGSLTLGEAVREAKAAVPDPDLRRTWILFGDPAIRLK